MNATRLLQAFAGSVFGGSIEKGRRRKVAQEVRVARGVETAVAEGLEGRVLFAVTASLNTTTHVLTVSGDANANIVTIYQIDFATDEIGVRVAGVSPDLGPFYETDVNSIVFHGGNGDDTLIVDNSTRGSLIGVAVTKPTTINGDYGDDTIWGSDQADTISGNYGSDTINGAGGNDLINGGYGDDTDTAADDLRGNAGNDTLRGEGGNDDLDTGTGQDSALGGAGVDTFWSGEGDGVGAGDYLDGGADSDILGSSDQSDTVVSIP